MKRQVLSRLFWTAAAALVLTTSGAAQVGKSQGVADVNIVVEKDLAALPNITPAIAKALIAKRPFKSPTELHAFLLSQGLTAEQAATFYQSAFVHINLNTATVEEIMLVPGAGRRMSREFPEYRPWRNYAQFDKEIGKYVGADATAKLAQYTFIPMNANTASDADLMTVPGASQSWVDALKKGRPYKTAADLEKIAGRGQARFFVIQ